MLTRLVPALLLVVPATAALWAGVEFVQAAEECRARPGSTAPPGSGWYYRISRADHRRCWFLGAKNASSHFARHRQVAVESAGRAPQEQQAGTQPQIGSSQTEFVDGALPSARSAVPQAGAATLDTATEYLVPRIVPTVTFRQPSPNPQTSMQPIVNAAQTMEQPSTRPSNPLLLSQRLPKQQRRACYLLAEASFSRFSYAVDGKSKRFCATAIHRWLLRSECQQ